jgi:hypothetical protein
MVLTYEVCWSCAGSTVVDMQLILSLGSGVDIIVGGLYDATQKVQGRGSGFNVGCFCDDTLMRTA